MGSFSVQELEANPGAMATELVKVQDTLCSITIASAERAERAASRIGNLMLGMLAAAVGFSILAVALLFLGRDLLDVVGPAIGVLVTGTVWVALKTTQSDERAAGVAYRKEADEKGYCKQPAASGRVTDSRGASSEPRDEFSAATSGS